MKIKFKKNVIRLKDQLESLMEQLQLLIVLQVKKKKKTTKHKIN